MRCVWNVGFIIQVKNFVHVEMGRAVRWLDVACSGVKSKIRSGRWKWGWEALAVLPLNPENNKGGKPCGPGLCLACDKLSVVVRHVLEHPSIMHSKIDIYALREICFSPLKTGQKKLKVLFCWMSSDFRKRIAFLEGSQTSSVCPFGKRNMYMEMSMKHW